MTVCGWRGSARRLVVVERRERLHEELARSVSSARSMISSTGSTPRARGDLGDRGVRRQRRVEHLHPVELGRPGLAAERLGVRAVVGDLHQPRDDVRVVEPARAARRAGSARTRATREAGRTAAAVRNDDNVPMPRRMGQPDRARRRRRRRRGTRAPASFIAADHDRDARSSTRELDELSRRRSLVGRRRVLDELEHAGAELAEHVDERAHLVPRREPRRDRPVVGRLVVDRARGREPERAGAQRRGRARPPSRAGRRRSPSPSNARSPIT